MLKISLKKSLATLAILLTLLSFTPNLLAPQTLQAKAALPNPFTKTVGSGIGMQGNVDSYRPNFNADLDIIKDMGLSVVRGASDWYDVEYTKGTYDWTRADSLMNGIITRGMKPMIILGYGNGLYHVPPTTDYGHSDHMCTDVEHDAYINFARAYINRHKGKGVIWEFINEADTFLFDKCIGSMPAGTTKGSLYAKILTKASALKDEFPNEYMMTGGTAFGGGFWYDMFNGMTVATIRKFDALGYHEYDNVAGKNSQSNYRTYKLNSIYGAMNSKGVGDMPIFDTETGGSGGDNFEASQYDDMWDGFDPDNTLSDDQQAAYAPRTYLFSLVNSSSFTNLHRLSDRLPDECSGQTENRDTGFGYIRCDRSKKPSYYALKTMIDNLKGYTYKANRSIDNPNKPELNLYRIINADLEFEKNGNKAFAFWAVQESPNDANNVYKHTRNASFNVPNGRYKVVDMLGNNIQYKTVTTGKADVVGLNEYPQYWIQDNVVVAPTADFTANLVGSPTANPSPTIDGTMDSSYTSNPVKALTNLTPASNDPADLSANFRSTWDANNLYLHFDVNDQTLLTPASLPAYQRDGIEVLLDSNNSKGASYDGVNDCKITLPADITNAQAPEVYGAPNCNTTGIVYKTVAKTGGYQMEIKIPFTTLGTNPATHAVNDFLGFDVQISDTDVIASPRESILTLKNPNVGTIWNTPQTWGNLKLEPAGVVTQTDMIVNLKANLQGAYSTTNSTMTNTLKTNNNNLLPLNGLANQAAIPLDSVDWVTVDLKQSGAVVESKQALVNQAGNITVSFTKPAGSYHINIKHRNHLAISTDIAVNLVAGNNTLIDFTGNNNVKGGNQALLKAGVFGMKRGNANSDLKIDAQDRSLVRTALDSNNIYSNIDLNMDGVINSLDKSIARFTFDSTAALN
jgi:hypothetical protein